ncbi:helix-turn-helix transcriptional regulator [Serratia marcescens]|uniref:helix-turn-helix transcriptional regulator n=1 Tax=Serratia marcescens TaxID=615 RepID=UPI003EDF6543
MKPLNIIIDDENLYFAAGLQFSIAEYARINGVAVSFITMEEEGGGDVIFASEVRRIQHWCTPWRKGNIGQIVLIKGRVVGRREDRVDVLYRTGAIDELFIILDRLFSERLEGRQWNTPQWTFTQRESQVINCLQRGFDQSQTAQIIGVSVKTVHSHKRSIMGKLMLTRQHDFIYWLLAQKIERYKVVSKG